MKSRPKYKIIHESNEFLPYSICCLQNNPQIYIPIKGCYFKTKFGAENWIKRKLESENK